MNDAGPSNSPDPARGFRPTDEQLSAELRKWTGASPALHPVGELLDRHWEAAFAYARLCTDGPRSAGMLTTAAFTRLFGETLRQNGPSSAWRPHLLVTVRRIAAEWAGDHRRDTLHPGLRCEDGERPAARLLPPAHRRLLSGAFPRLPQSARCLLWHVEVEAEPLTAPAGLLGLDEEGARVELERARGRLREECLQLHRELAPDEECRRYLRLLDVTYRRGGRDIDPDLRAHIGRCGHCGAAADQLGHFNSGLGAALAEAVLGWGGRQYAEDRRRAAAGDSAVGEPPGFAGPFGPAGPERSAGPAGSGGRAGSAGPAGSAGRAHYADPAGSAGPARFTGPAGPAGPTRPMGPVGNADPVGAVGPASPADLPDPAHPAGVAGPSRAAREAFPDPVVLAGAIGESFTDPPGAAAGGGSAPPAVARDPEALSPPDPAPVPAPAAPAPPAGAPGGRPPGARAAARRSAHKAARRAARRRHLTAGVLTVGGLVVLPLVLWSVAGDGNPSGAGRGAEEAPGPDATERTRDPSWAGAGDAGNGALRGRLHNVGSGLCVGVEGERVVEDAEAELVPCSTDTTQQWTYETDGLLRSGAAPELCLDSRLGYSVRLAPCTGAAQPDSRNVRYDFTRQGALVPRWDQDLALAPAATDGSGALVVKARADQDAQRWVVDTSKADLRMEAVTWDVALPSPRFAPTRTAAPIPAGTTAPPPAASASPASPVPSGTASGAPSCDRYGHHCDEDGRYGSPGYGRPGYGYGYPGYGYGGYGPDGYGGDGGR